jgi:hypothetical protein
MEVFGLKQFDIRSIRKPGNWRAILEEPGVMRKALSIQGVGLIHEPLVRRSDKLLVVGQRRVAAHEKLGLTSFLGKDIECSDEEVTILRRVENAERDHNPGQQAADMADLVNLYEKNLATTWPDRDADGKRKSKRARARELVAQERGVKPSSVRMAEYRAQKRTELPKSTLANLGMDLDAVFVEQVAHVHAELTTIAGRVQSAVTAIGALLRSDKPVQHARLEPLKAQLSDTAAALRKYLPVSLCPNCKGLETVQKECVACLATGYITRAQEADVPASLLDEAHPMVTFRGKLVPVEDVPSDPWGLAEDDAARDYEPGDVDDHG